jgi:hypothetical protein
MPYYLRRVPSGLFELGTLGSEVSNPLSVNRSLQDIHCSILLLFLYFMSYYYYCITGYYNLKQMHSISDRY